MQVAGSEESENGFLSDEASRSSGATWKRVTQGSTLIIFSLAFLGVANSILEPHGLQKAKVDVVVDLHASWNQHVHAMVKNCGGDCSLGALIGLNAGKLWTTAGPGILPVAAREAQAILTGIKNPDQFQANGIHVAGQKYFKVRTLDNVVFGWKKDVGGIILNPSKTAIVVLDSKNGKFPARSLVSAGQEANHLVSAGFRRLQHDEDEQSVVIEMGPAFTRVGISGDEKPRHVDTEKTFYDEKSGFADVSKAMANLKRVLEASKLTIKDRVVIMSDTVFLAPQHREELVRQMFEDFGVGGFKVSDASAGALNVAGKLTGVGVHLHKDSATIEPCYEGFAMPDPSQFVVLEADGANLGEYIYKSIMKCDVDLRKELYKGIVLYGERPGLADLQVSVQKAVKELAPPGFQIKVQAQGKDEHWSFLGLSIVSSLSSFKEKTMTKKDYDEAGPSFMKYFDL